MTLLKMTRTQLPIRMPTVSTDRADRLYFFCIHDTMKSSVERNDYDLSANTI